MKLTKLELEILKRCLEVYQETYRTVKQTKEWNPYLICPEEGRSGICSLLFYRVKLREVKTALELKEKIYLSLKHWNVPKSVAYNDTYLCIPVRRCTTKRRALLSIQCRIDYLEFALENKRLW